MNRKLLFFLTLLSLLSAGFARVSFAIRDFSAADFRNPELLNELCAGDNPTSFWCGEREANLKLVTSKGVDYIFTETGEVVAIYAKQQRGQDFRGNYALDNQRNLIPYGAAVPGGAVLVDGQYTEPQNAQGSWTETTYAEAPALEGTFTYQVGNLNVEKTLLISAVRNSIGVSLTVSRGAGQGAAGQGAAGQGANGQGEVLVQYAYPGIARQAQPVIKLGQGETFTLNPAQGEVANPSYISLQNNNRNMGVALVMRPNPNVEGSGGESLSATPLSATQIALGKTLPAGVDASVNMELQVYGGPNEMVHFLQEDYLELPGLFNPNILGRLSLGIIIVLQWIHGVVGGWGLSIILLTLLFRILVWPLIHTQMKSMAGMQKIQPKLQELQQKYKNDREKLTQETMKMYQEAGVNPAGGCLPALIQMPIFLVLWRVFVNFEFNEGFLWIPDLGLNDPIYLLPILYIGIMVLQVFISSKGNRQTLQQQLLISGVFVFFAFSFPAGVTLYLITSMGIQVLQQWLIMRRLDAAPARITPTSAKAAVPAPKADKLAAKDAKPVSKPARQSTNKPTKKAKAK